MTYDPPVAFSFSVQIIGEDQVKSAFFQEVSGLSARHDTKAIPETGENRVVHKLPTTTQHENLVLKRGLVNSNSALFAWAKDTLEGGLAEPIKPKDLTVSLLNQDQASVMTWQIYRAWPVKWSTGGFDAMKDNAMIETLEIAFAHLTRIPGDAG